MTETGADAGDGWAEVSLPWHFYLSCALSVTDSLPCTIVQVSKDGRTGLVPLAYLSVD